LCSYLLTIPALETRVDRSENYVDPPGKMHLLWNPTGLQTALVLPTRNRSQGETPTAVSKKLNHGQPLFVLSHI